jgi:hypothetical protein
MELFEKILLIIVIALIILIIFISGIILASIQEKNNVTKFCDGNKILTYKNNYYCDGHLFACNSSGYCEYIYNFRCD